MVYRHQNQSLVLVGLLLVHSVENHLIAAQIHQTAKALTAADIHQIVESLSLIAAVLVVDNLQTVAQVCYKLVEALLAD